MDKKLVALISKMQLKNMKTAGFKLIDVTDSGDYTTSTTKTAKFATWQFVKWPDTDCEVNIILEVPVELQMNKGQLFGRIFSEGVDAQYNLSKSL